MRLLTTTLAIVPALLGLAPGTPAATVVIDTDTTYQTIAGFGGAVLVGPTNEARQPLYSDPAFLDFLAYDLGVSMVRIQLDPGILPGPVADADDIRAEDFDSEGLSTQMIVDLAHALQDRDPAIKIVASTWSPPGWMKDSGRTSGTRAGYVLNAGADSDNRLSDSRYEEAAAWFVEYTRMLRDKGVDLYALSPQNELMFTEPYDSCMYLPDEYARLVKLIGQTFDARGVERPLIFGPEDMTLATYNTSRHKPYVDDLMAPDVAPYFDVFATHGYTNGVQSGSSLDPQAYWEGIKQFGRPYWITEGGTGEHTWPAVVTSGIGPYLHHALVGGNASVFLAWQISDPANSDSNVMLWDTPTKKTYVAMHYWRYIRPGFRRVDAAVSGTGAADLDVSAFKDPAGERIVVVAINTSSSDRTLDMQVGGSVTVSHLDAFQTTSSTNFAHLGSLPLSDGHLSASLPGYSITTFVALEPVLGVSLEDSAVEVQLGSTHHLVSSLSPASATDRRMTWTSSDESVATVDATGWVTAKAPGFATITVTTDDGGHTASATVNVVPKATWASWPVQDGIADTGGFMGPLYIHGNSGWVYAYNLGSWVYLPEEAVQPGVAWGFFADAGAQDAAAREPMAASAGPVATQGARGMAAEATNVALGKDVTVSGADDLAHFLVDGNTSAQAGVRWSAEVFPQWAMIDLQGLFDISEFRMYPFENRPYRYVIETSQDGESFGIAVDRRDNDTSATALVDDVAPVRARYVRWMITGAGTGYAGSWVSIGELQVYGAQSVLAVSGISLSRTSLTRGVGQQWQLHATIEPRYASNPAVTWTSSDKAVATVDTTGLVSAVSTGDAVITARTLDGGYAATASVHVVAGPQWGHWSLSQDGVADSGPFLGAVWVDPASGWAYDYPLAHWIYLDEQWITPTGSWVMILRP